MGWTNYQNTRPGSKGLSAITFPSSDQLSQSPDRKTLILFLHPRCPCSRASVRELDRLLASESRCVSATVVFTCPPGSTPDFHLGPLWESVVRIPHIQVVVDSEGSLARSHGAATSGHAFLYDATGILAFEGGITSSRGHEGDNAFASQLKSCLREPTSSSSLISTPVFGCPLFAEG